MRDAANRRSKQIPGRLAEVVVKHESLLGEPKPYLSGIRGELAAAAICSTRHCVPVTQEYAV